MIIIGKPEIKNIESKARLQTEIDIDGKKDVIWFEVEERFGEYLCYERCDAFVIALLNYAMRNAHDIKCMAPMGEDLHYQVSTYLIDAVYKGSKVLHKTKIVAEIDSTDLPNANAVGTGISNGIDSLYAIATHSNTPYKNHNITHLAFNNVGSHGEGERAVSLYNARKKKAREFAEEYGYEFIESNSNIHDVVQQNHLLTNTYTSCFAIYCMQKLYSVYYYASAHAFIEFSLKDNEKYDTAFYDLLSLSVFSTKDIKIFSQGGTLTRLEKTKVVSNYLPSYKYLNVCTATAENCSKCEKCTRTILALDAIGKLDNYSYVFDLKYYKENVQKYYSRLIFQRKQGNINYIELYPLLKDKIAFSSYLKGNVMGLKPKLISFIPRKLRLFIKKMLGKK